MPPHKHAAKRSPPGKRPRASSAGAKPAAQSLHPPQTIEEKLNPQQRIEALYEVTRAISSTFELQEVLAILVDKVRSFLPTSRGSIRLHDHETGKLEPVASWNLSAEDLTQFKGGLSRAAFDAVEPLIVRDIKTDPRASNPGFAARNNVKSFVGIALRARGAKLGVLTCDTRGEHNFSREEVEFLTTLADQAAIAIHNAQLHEKLSDQAAALIHTNDELNRHLLSLQALQRVTSSLNQSLQAGPVIHNAVREITAIFRFEATRVFLYNRARDELHLFSSYEADPNLFARLTVFRKGEGVLGRVGETGEPIVFENAHRDPRYLELTLSKQAHATGYSFLAVYPVRSKAEILGAMVFVGRSPRCLEPYEDILIRSITEQIGVALENAELVRRLERNLDRARALRDVSLAVNSNLDLQVVLNVLLEQADRVVPHAAAEIRLLNQETGALEPTACRNLDVDEWKAVRAGRGLAKIVLETRAPLAIRDVQHDPRTSNPGFMKRESILSFLGVPLTVMGEVIGCFIVLTREPHDFVDEEIELFSALAGQAAIAIHKARLYEQVKQQAEELTEANAVQRRHTLEQAVLAHLGNLALGGCEIQSLMDEAVVLVAQTLEVEYAKVLELLPDRNALLLRAGVGWKEGLVGQATVGAEYESQAGYTLLSYEPVIVEDLATETRFSGPAVLYEHGVVSGVSVVIYGEGGAYGVLGAHSTKRRRFTNEQVAFVQSVANLLATALERKRAVDVIVEMNLALAHAMPGISRLDSNARYVSVNEEYARMLGYSPSDLVGKRWEPTVHLDDRPQAIAAYQRMLREGQGEFEARAMRADGSTFFKQVLMVKAVDAGGAFIGHHCFMRDISERKQAEEAVRTSEERFRLAARATNDALWEWNMATDEVWWNEGPVTLFRYSPAEVKPDFVWWEERIHPKDKERVVTGVQAAIESGQRTWRGEYRFRRGDGAYAYVVDRGYVVRDADGKPVRMIGCMTDITARREAEEKLTEAHRELRALADRLATSKEEEAKRIARELHDETGQLLASVYLALDDFSKSASPPQQESLGKIRAMLDRIDEQLHAISQGLRPTVLDDLGLMPALHSLAQSVAALSGVRVSLEDSDLARLPSVVESSLYRIVQEALNNVVKHARATEVRIHIRQENGRVRCLICDDGIGFDVRRALARPGRESLGLVGMRERVERLGGSLTIDSTDRRGTELSVTIPAEG